MLEEPPINEVVTPQPEKSPVTASSYKNTLGIVALILSFIGLLAVLSLVGLIIGILLLLLALLFGGIALFKPPRGQARASVIISTVTLSVLGYVAYRVVVTIMVTPIEIVPDLQVVVSQPGFSSFFETRMKTRIRNLDLQTLQADFPMTSNIKEMVQYYTALIIEEMKKELIVSIDAWQTLYGLPSSEVVPNELPDSEVAPLPPSLDESSENVVIQDVEQLLTSLDTAD